MTAVGKTATVSLSKDARLKFAEGNVAHNAWAAWKVGQAIAKRRGIPVTRDGSILGYEHAITMVEILLTTFPELRVVHRDDMDSLTGTIREYLRETGNAYCTQKDPAKGIRWWIRAEWNDTPHAVVHGGLALTSRERRLTSVEAGEDRPAAPVTVTRPEPAVVDPGPATRIIEVLTEYGGPLSRAEIGSLLDPPVELGRLRQTLRDLTAAGQILAWSGTDCDRPLLKAGGRYYTPPTWEPAPTPVPEPYQPPIGQLVPWPEARIRGQAHREKVARWLPGRKRSVTVGDTARALGIPLPGARNALDALVKSGAAVLMVGERRKGMAASTRLYRSTVTAAPTTAVPDQAVVAHPLDPSLDGVAGAITDLINAATTNLRGEVTRLQAENDALRGRLAQLIPVDQLLGGPK